VTDGTDIVGIVDSGGITRDVPRQPRESPWGVGKLPHLADPAKGLATSDLVAEGHNLIMQWLVVARQEHRLRQALHKPVPITVPA
jgi:hypothetical protein